MNASPGKLRPFFVSGSPKSGTTWVQRILDTHPHVACAGEGHFIEQIVRPMVQLLRGYNAKLQQVSERVYQGRAPYPPLAQAEMIELTRDFTVRLMMRQGLPEGVRWVGDKTPRYTEHLKELRALFPSARFIHIVRDPRDVAVSRLFHAQRAGYADALKPGTETYYKLVGNAAQAWALHNGNVESFKRTCPARVHELTYEGLLEDFETNVAALFAFLEVECSAELIAQVKAQTDFSALSGRARGDEDPASFFRKGISGDWQGRLDSKALEIVQSHCADIMRSRGYR